MQSFSLQGVIVSILEAAALTAFAFLVATHLHPAKSILLTSGIFLFTAFIGMCCCCCNRRQPIRQRERTSQCARYCDRFMNSSFVNIIAFVLQLGGIVGGVFLLAYTNEQQFERWLQIDLGQRWRYIVRVSLAALLAGPLLSVLWSRVVQRLIFHKKQTFQNSDESNRARSELPASRCGGMQSTHTYILYIDTYIHTYIHTYTCMYTHTHIRTRTHTYTCIYIHTRTHTHGHTHMHSVHTHCVGH